MPLARRQDASRPTCVHCHGAVWIVRSVTRKGDSSQVGNGVRARPVYEPGHGFLVRDVKHAAIRRRDRYMARRNQLGIEPYDFMEDAIQAAVKAAQ